MMPATVLRDLMLSGLEGAALLAAFEAKMNKPATQPATLAIVGPTARPVVAVAPPQGAKAIGRKALANADLPASAVRIGSCLFDHFNLTTGRCDPGQGRIATATGIPERTVRRSLTRLATAGLFGIVRHGGRMHTNAYVPNWPLLEQLAGKIEHEQPGQKWPVHPAKSGHQNHISKPESSQSLRKHSVAKRREPDRRQIPMVLPIPGGRDVAEARRDAAQRRLWTALRTHLAALGKAVLASVLPAIPEPVFAEAVEREEAHPGAGLRHVLVWLEREGPLHGAASPGLGKTGTGPP